MYDDNAFLGAEHGPVGDGWLLDDHGPGGSLLELPEMPDSLADWPVD